MGDLPEECYKDIIMNHGITKLAKMFESAPRKFIQK
jgi:hypothetical protein